MVNKKCSDVTLGMKTPPFGENNVNQCIKMFPNIETINGSFQRFRSFENVGKKVKRINCWDSIHVDLVNLPKEHRNKFSSIKCYANSRLIREFKHLKKIDIDFTKTRFKKNEFLKVLNSLIYLRVLILRGVNERYLEYLIISDTLKEINYKIRTTIIGNGLGKKQIEKVPKNIYVTVDVFDKKLLSCENVFLTQEPKDVKIHTGNITFVRNVMKKYLFSSLSISSLISVSELQHFVSLRKLEITGLVHEDMIVMPPYITYLNCDVAVRQLKLESIPLKYLYLKETDYVSLPTTLSSLTISKFNDTLEIVDGTHLKELYLLNYTYKSWRARIELPKNLKHLTLPNNIQSYDIPKLADLKLKSLVFTGNKIAISQFTKTRYIWSNYIHLPTTLSALTMSYCPFAVDNMELLHLQRLRIDMDYACLQLKVPTTLTNLEVPKKYVNVENMSDLAYFND
ncbi:hypothetical protein QTN25_005924 [Entamoeba marina]